MIKSCGSNLFYVREQAKKIGFNIFRALHAAGSGHMGGSLSVADILAALYFCYMKPRPNDLEWPTKDKFILSRGHANATMGAVLVQGRHISKDILEQFYGFESLFRMHPDIKLPGI